MDEATFTRRLESLDGLTEPGARFETEAVTVHGSVRRNYVRRPSDLLTMFTKSVELNAEAVALVEGDRRVTFSELDGRVRMLTADLQERGLKPGDRVGILGANSVEWIEAFWACVRGGFVSVPLNALWTRDELAYAIEHSEMTACFIDQRRHKVVDGLLSADRWLALGMVDGVSSAGSDSEPTSPDIAEDDLLSIFYTSGTTGRPKGAMIDHRGIVANLENLVYFTIRSRILRGTPRRSKAEPRTQNVSLLAVPLFHVTGCHALMVVSLLFGNSIVLYPPRSFDADVAMELMERHAVTTFVGVPTLMMRILDAEGFGNYDLTSLTTVGFGGAAVNPDLARRTKAAFGHVDSLSNGYGLTETNAAVIGNYGVEYERRPDSVGKPAPNVDVLIVDTDGASVPAGVRGEIVIGGPMLMAGYWRNPEATAGAVRDGWFHTGDVGIIDEAGYVLVVDRIKDVVIRGGENIYSAEVEHVLESHPAVVEVAIVGVAHEQLGEEVKAVIVSREDVEVETLAEYCRARLAGFKVPSVWEIRSDPLPRNAAGKVTKLELRGS